jgi:hypothetical protein
MTLRVPRVPAISTFYGILIQIFWEASLPRRALALVLEWAAEHPAELMEDWDLCSRMPTPRRSRR